MELRHTLALLALLALAAPATAQRGVGTSAPISAADLRQRLFRIAHDSMKGRETGTREDSLAADYVAAEFKRVGLRPAGEDGGWFQRVPFYVPAPVSPTLDVHDGNPLIAGRDFVSIGRVTSIVASREVTVVYGGVANDSTTWLPSAEAAGRLVVLGLQAPANGSRPTFSQQVFNNPRFARARGIAIVAIGVIAPAQQAMLTRIRPTIDTTRGPARPFQMLLTPRTAERIFGEPVATLRSGTLGLQALAGNPALNWAPIAHTARNVIGVLPGRDPMLSGQYVSLTAHNDHVGICGPPVDHDSLRAFNRVYRPMGADNRTWTVSPDSDVRVKHLLDSLRKIRPARPDSICNGADDDGSGTVALLELAEYFASLPTLERPRRSLLFVSHVAEEIGLVGSAWYTDHATVPIDSIVAEIDEDMIGRGRIDDLPAGGPTYLEVVGLRRLSNEFGDVMEQVNAKQPVPFVFNYQFDQPGDPLRYYCRADHYNYARYGIPAVALSRGEHLDYHQVTDEPQYIDYEDMTRVVNLVRDATLRIGSMDGRPKLDKPKGDPHATCVQ